MKNAKKIYHVLLVFYPHSYRKAFGAQMMQTFIDNYQDIEKSEGRVGMFFWLSTITDEIKNITQQRMISLLEENKFFTVTILKVVVSVMLVFPLYAVFFAALVKVSLALPHPHVSGIGVLIALATLLLLPGVFSMAASYVLVSALATIFPKHSVRTA